MRLIFQVRFHTEMGQRLSISGNHPLFGNGDPEKVFPLQYLNEEFWIGMMEFAPGAAPDAEITYNYLLHDKDGSLIEDWGSGRVINPAAFKEDKVLIIDDWNNAAYYQNAFSTEPFKQVLLKPNHTEARVPVPGLTTHTFKVKAPLLAKGQTLCLVGRSPALGNWSTSNPVLLNRISGEDFLTAKLDLSNGSFPISYKYGVYDVEKQAFLGYEDGKDRTLWDKAAPHKTTVVTDGFARLPSAVWKGAGVAIPVFSLRSENSFGVGEFTDLKPLADWCKRTGLKLIQVLPINDTTATHSKADSYPYSAISAFALHPIYLNLSHVATGENRARLAQLEPERKRLNALETLDYDAVMKAKATFIKQLYASQKEKTFQSEDYRQFFDQNKAWLVPYAIFCHLRDKHGTANYNQWPEHNTCTAGTIATLAQEGSAACDAIALNYFIQYHLHRQLREAVEYAHANGVILKGDLAIGVYRYGADTWQKPELYHLDMQAGAPPDPFAARGQNWSFPTYNWPRMQQDGFAWWKQRFGQMSNYFDAFRVDHILGFFRIWSIPLHAVEGILGHFVRALPVLASEFAARGIAFDQNRYLKPYITEQVLKEIFGNESESAKKQFLHTDHFGDYALRPEFSTQRQVESHFAVLEDNEQHRKLKQGLYDLISNVLLLEAEEADGVRPSPADQTAPEWSDAPADSKLAAPGDGRTPRAPATPNGQEFHFRFGIEDTPSFRDLDALTQRRLMELYIDYFYRRQEGFWMKEGMQKLPALKRDTDMLICGEDLGMVPACVPEAMKQLGLLSLEVQRMPKTKEQEFSSPKDAPYLSVVTPSTHDMSTIRGWWEEDRTTTQDFYNKELGRPGEAPPKCETWVNKAIVVQHLASPAMWSIFQLQDLLGMDEHLRHPNPAAERINVPANPKHYWCYRMHLTLEQLLGADAFNDDLRTRVQQSGR